MTQTLCHQVLRNTLKTRTPLFSLAARSSTIPGQGRADAIKAACGFGLSQGTG